MMKIVCLLKRKPGTVRQWERRGIIPPAAHHGTGNGSARTKRGAFGDGSGGARRMYTSAEIMAAAEIAAGEGLLLGKGQMVDITSTMFAHRVKSAWDRLRATEGKA